MYKTRSMHLFPKVLPSIALTVLLFIPFLSGSVEAVRALGEGAEPNQSDGDTLYYFAEGNRIPLTPSLRWISVKFSESLSDQTAALENFAPMVGSLDQARPILFGDITLLPLNANMNVQSVLAGVNAMRADTTKFSQVYPVFQTADAEMALTDEFIVTFPPGFRMDDIHNVNAFHGVELVEPVLGQENTFVLRVASGVDVLAMANLYQESGVALHSAPNFVRILTSKPAVGQIPHSIAPMTDVNDPLYANQWYLNNTQQFGPETKNDADIDAPEAWALTTGSSSIIIAVIDEGVDLMHEDYKSNLVVGYDATGLGSKGAPVADDAHGTNVSGLIAASANNGLGVAGVCPQCRIMPVRVAYGDKYGYWVTDDATIANGIAWAYQNGASILNNSWGGGLESTAINTAIANARSFGRGGKGSVVVFAAGNNNMTVMYPANLENVITVSASNLCDQRKQPMDDACNGNEYWWGSSYGNSVDVSAPGVLLYSTDITGAAGYDAGNYFAEMNGTSGAAPIVSGVAGLILSLNPNLTADEVQNILQSTADDVNGDGYDVDMGYGRVNAYNAALAANASSITFTDVPNTYWAYDFIERLYNSGVTRGCSSDPLSYCPLAAVTRAQMAIFILRGMHGDTYVPPTASGTVFTDVTAETFGAAWIEQFALEGITSGCGSGAFCPNDNVTRAQMAIFLLKGKYGASYVPPAATGIFADVPVGSFAADWIEQLAAEGITSGCGGGNFCPDQNVTRDQMAVFLVKAFNLP